MDLKQLIVWAFQASILATVLGFGLKATVGDLLYLIRQPSVLARSLLAMFVVMPLIAVLLARAFDFSHTVEVALIALAISPLPPLIPNKLTQPDDRPSNAIALTATIGLLSIAIVPLLVELLARYAGRPVTASPRTVATVVVTMVLLPLVAGIILRAAWPALAERIEPLVSTVGSVLLRVAALALLVTALPAMWALIGNGTLIAIAIFVLAGLAAGHVLGGPDADGRTMLALAAASRHPAIAFAIASANFPEERFGATILLYLLMSALAGVPYTLLQRKKARDVEAAAAILEAQQKAVDDIRAGRPAPYFIAPPAASEAMRSPPSPDAGHAVKKSGG
jgi:BASS family bile acid:Na+ symporter